MKYNKIFILVWVVLLIFSLLPAYSLSADKKENIKEWIAQLSDRRERTEAKNKLIKAKGEAADELLTTLKDEYTKSSVRIDIIEICRKNKIRKSIPALKEMANSPKARFRLASLRALEAIGDKEFAGIFKGASKDPYAEVRFVAISALKKREDRSAIPHFIESLSDEEVRIRFKALDALALFNDKSAIPALVERLYDKNDTAILKAIDILSNFKDKQAVEALIEKLDTWNIPVKIRVIKALAKIKDKSALPHLEPLLNDEYIDVRRAARAAVDVIEAV